MPLDLKEIRDALAGIDTELGKDYPHAGYFMDACRQLLDRLEELEKREEAWVKFGEAVKYAAGYAKANSTEWSVYNKIEQTLLLRPPTV